MKKIIFSCTLLCLPFSAITNADTGHRVGLGFATTEVEDYAGNQIDWGMGFKLEYGYDFNRVIGINASYTNTSDDVYHNYGSLRYGAEVKSHTYKIDTDIGYAFQLNDFSIKPYGAIGLASNREKLTIHLDDRSTSQSYNDNSLYLGVGVRTTLGMGVYTDIRMDFPTFDDVYTDQFSFSMGYRF